MIGVVVLESDTNASQKLGSVISNHQELNYFGSYPVTLESLTVIRRIKPDVIYLEVNSESDTGLEIARIVKEIFPNVHLVVMVDHNKYAEEAENIGVLDYILKPFEDSRIDLSIMKILKSREEISVGLRINSFGNFNLFDNELNIVRWRTRKSKELFVLLWLNNNSILSRDIIIEKIFPNLEIQKSSALLSTTLYQLRGVLENVFEGDVIQYINNGYKLVQKIDSDYNDIKEILYSNTYSLENYFKIKHLYSNHFLEEEGYDWARRYGEQISLEIKLHLLKLLEIVDLESDKSIKEGILMFIYELDPLDENMAIQLLDFYYKENLKIKIVNFYKQHKQKMNELLSANPSNVVTSLYLSYRR